MKKLVYKKCRWCGRKDTCYKVKSPRGGYRIHCIRLDEVSHKATTDVNRILGSL